MINFRDHMINEQIKCAICHADINVSSPIFQSKFNYSVICSRCKNLFNQEEIEIALNLFTLYGGYFGKYREDQFSIIERLLKIVENEDENFNPEITNMKLLHFALIHGITPGEFNRSLEALIKD